MPPFISIIIPTKNEEAHIGNCLQSLAIQICAKQNFEILIVDNHSTDKTVQIASRFTKRVYQQGPERSAQRNYGAQLAKGKYLLFLDADMLASPTLLASIQAHLASDPQSVALYVPELILGRTLWQQSRRLERMFYQATQVDSPRVMQKAAFVASGGFDPKLSAFEDWDLDRRLRACGSFAALPLPTFSHLHRALNRFKYTPSTLVASLGKLCRDPCLFHNELAHSFRSYIGKKQTYSQHGLASFAHRWGRGDPAINPLYRSLTVFIENGKWRFIFQYPHLFLFILVQKFVITLIYLQAIFTSTHQTSNT